MTEFPALSAGQEFGAEFLRTRGVAGLFDRPGYGKTAQFVRAIDMLDGPATILCPPAAARGEVQQFALWSLFDLPVTILRTGADDVPKHGHVICNYALAGTPNMAAKLRKRGCAALVLDESHHLKNSTGARTKAVFSAKGIASTAERVWFVTGTPTPNDASEYYVFAKACGAWTGTKNQFVERYCLTADSRFGTKIIGTNPATLPELMKMLEPHALGRDGVEDGRSELVLDTTEVEGGAPDFSGVDAATLEAIRAAVEAGSWKSLDGAAVATVRRQTGVAKAKGCAELIRAAVDAGHRQVLAFCEHTAVIDTLASELSDFSVGIIDGRTSEKLRERIIFDFEPYDGPRRPVQFQIAICQRQALKEARTMTGATRVVLCEPSWTPEDNTQMIARAWRRGQRMPVYASFAHLPGSIDEAVAKTLARKTADIERIKIISGPR